MNWEKNTKISVGILLTVSFILTFMFVVVPRVNAATGCFPDTNGHWAETFICWLSNNGIAGGYPDGDYKPGNNVTRAEVAVMLNKLYGLVDDSFASKPERVQAPFSFLVYENDSAFPLAHGNVDSDGNFEDSTYASGTKTLSVNWDAVSEWYEITISGVSFHYTDYTVLVSTVDDNTFCKYSSVSGDLLVVCYDVQ